MPARKGGYWYYTRTVEGQQYGVHCRRAVRDGRDRRRRSAPTAPRWTARRCCSTATCWPRGTTSSPSAPSTSARTARWLAYSTDFAGDERFTLRVKDLTTGEVLADEVPDTFYGTAWSADASTLFYVTVDEAWRPQPGLAAHRSAPPPSEDVVVYEENDERFWVGRRADPLRAVRPDRHPQQGHQRGTGRSRRPTRPASRRSIAPRRQGVEYAVEHHGAPVPDPAQRRRGGLRAGVHLGGRARATGRR